MMKNASIKEMIRKQKMDANDRKDMVSSPVDIADLYSLSFVFRNNAKRKCNSAIGLSTASSKKIISAWKLKRR